MKFISSVERDIERVSAANERDIFSTREVNSIDFQAFMYFCVYFIYYEPLLPATAFNSDFLLVS
jgi:hypothetical protein